MKLSHTRYLASDLERLFEGCFRGTYNVILQGGAPEPFYAPAADMEPARILYTLDYFRSALHEVAHWCVAGPNRRQLPDYGYWYAPDGRNAEQQAEFERVEVRPQAYELIFCAASGANFRVSLDNLEGGPHNTAAFEAAVHHKAHTLLQQGLPTRTLQWARTLARFYRLEDPVRAEWIDQVFHRSL